MNKNKKKQILFNGVILSIIAVGLSVYFSVQGLWGIAQVIIIIIVAGISALQFWLVKSFFN